MKRCAALFLLLICSLPIFADDRGNAEKELRKVTAMATDPTGRRVVSETVADTLNLPRPQLVMERRNLGLSYGQLFILHKLATPETKLEDLAVQIKRAKTFSNLPQAGNLDWKQFTSDAKKLNSKIEDNLYKYFIDPQPLRVRDDEENYTVMVDGVKEDNVGITQQDLDSAQQVYTATKEKASKNPGTKRMNTIEESTIRHDQIRDNSPQSPHSSDTGPATTPSGPK
jgi:hypothetical protein